MTKDIVPGSVFGATVKGALIGGGIGLALEAGKAVSKALDNIDAIARSLEADRGRDYANSLADDCLFQSIAMVRQSFDSVRRRATRQGLIIWMRELGREAKESDDLGPFVSEAYLLIHEIVRWQMLLLRRWNDALQEMELALALLETQLRPLGDRVLRHHEPATVVTDWPLYLHSFFCSLLRWDSSRLLAAFKALRQDNLGLIRQFLPKLVACRRNYFESDDAQQIAAFWAQETCSLAIHQNDQDNAAPLVFAELPSACGPGKRRFRVAGVMRATAREVEITIKATTPEAAREIVNSLGIAAATVLVQDDLAGPDRPLNKEERGWIQGERAYYAELEQNRAVDLIIKNINFGPNFMV